MKNFTVRYSMFFISVVLGLIILVDSATCFSQIVTSTSNSPSGLEPVYEAIDPYLATPAEGAVNIIPVLVIRFLPTADGVNLDVSKGPNFWSLGETTLENLKSRIDLLDKRNKFMLEEGSKYRGYKDPNAKPMIGYKVVEYITVYEHTPAGISVVKDKNGYPIYKPDYFQIFERFDVEHYVNDLGVKHIWFWGPQLDSGWPSYDPNIHDPADFRGAPEANMASPTTGDISNSYRDNTDLPIYDHTYVVFGNSYIRTQNEAVGHNYGHQIEHMLKYIDLQDNNQEDLFWQKFVGADENLESITGRCGWNHMPPNTTGNYDYLNPTLVESDIEDWRPDNSGEKKMVNVDTWRNLSYNWPSGTYIDDTNERTVAQWHMYWMQALPGAQANIPYQEDYIISDWWDIFANWDEANTSGQLLYETAPEPMASFYLVNAQTDERITEITEGDIVGTGDLSGELAIEVVPASPVGSFRISVEGPGISTAKNESVAPYASFGDDNGDFRGRVLAEGAYIVTAIPYSGRNATGEAGEPSRITFEIEESPGWSIAGFRFIDAQTDLPTTKLLTGGVTFTNFAFPDEVAIEVVPSKAIGSFRIGVEGPGISTAKNESVAPYASFGDDNGDFRGEILSEGRYVVSATPYSRRNAQGVAGETGAMTFDITYTDPPTPIFSATPTTGTAPLVVSFDASDFDDEDIRYHYDFGDGTYARTGVRTAHTYANPGEYKVVFTLESRAFGTVLGSQTITVDPNPSPIAGFQLIDADTDLPYAAITQGTIIDTYQLPRRLAIETLISEPIGSVRMEVLGPGINTASNQSDAPYASFGDDNGDFNGKTFGEGSYTVRATPYSGRNATGTAGIPLEISFDVVSESSFLFIGASGTETDGEFPHFNVMVNDEFVGEAFTSAELGEEFFFFFDIPPSKIETVKVQYDNDLQTATEDRNLTVNLLVINEGDPFFEAIFFTPYENLINSSVAYDRGPLDGVDVVPAPDGLLDVNGTLIFTINRSDYARVVQVSSKQPAKKSQKFFAEPESSEFDEQNFVMYPNPAQTLVQVNLPLPAEQAYTLQVYDIYGQTIIRQRGLGPVAESISLQELTRGTYLIAVESQGQRLVKKLLIEK